MEDQKNNTREERDMSRQPTGGQEDHNPFKDKEGKNLKEEPPQEDAQTEQQRKDALTERD